MTLWRLLCWIIGHDMVEDDLPDDVRGWGIYEATCKRCGHHESSSCR